MVEPKKRRKNEEEMNKERTLTERGKQKKREKSKGA